MQRPNSFHAAVYLLAVSALCLPATKGHTANTCFGKAPTIHGTDRSEELVGTPGNDVIVGGEGDDRIKGRGGNDRSCAGKGIDRLWGGRGGDRLRDHSPEEWGSVPILRGGKGHDRLFSRYGRLYGGLGNDLQKGRLLYGGPGDDVLKSNGINVWLFYRNAPRGIRISLEQGTAEGWGRDRISGEISQLIATRFDDILVGDDSSNDIDGRRGDDVVRGRGGQDSLDGDDPGWERKGRDRLFGGRGPDSLYGRPGRDYLDGGRGDDFLDGGDGVDTCVHGERVFYCEQ